MSDPSLPQQPQKPQQGPSQYHYRSPHSGGTAQQQPQSAPQQQQQQQQPQYAPQQQQPIAQQQGAPQYPSSPQYPATPQNTGTPRYPGAPQYPGTSQYPGAPQYPGMQPTTMAPKPAWMPQQARDTRPMNGLAVASLPVGIAGIILSVIPQLNIYGLFLGIVGLILSIIGICQTGPTRPTRGRGIAIVGTVFSGLAVVLTIAFCVLLITVLTSGGDGGFDYDDEDDTGSETEQEENVHQTDDTVGRIIRQAMAEKER